MVWRYTLSKVISPSIKMPCGGLAVSFNILLNTANLFFKKQNFVKTHYMKKMKRLGQKGSVSPF